MNVCITPIFTIVCIYGSHWQSGSVNTQCEYTADPSFQVINADVALGIGLKSMNVTLSGVCMCVCVCRYR